MCIMHGAPAVAAVAVAAAVVAGQCTHGFTTTAAVYRERDL